MESQVGLAVGRTGDNERIGFVVGAPGRSDLRILVASRPPAPSADLDLRSTVLFLPSGRVIGDGAAEPSLLAGRPVNVSVLNPSTDLPPEAVPMRLSELAADTALPLPCEVLDPVQPAGSLSAHIVGHDGRLVDVEIRSLGPEAALRLAGAPVVVRFPESPAPVVVAVLDPAVDRDAAQTTSAGARIVPAWSASALAAAMPELSAFVMPTSFRLSVHGDRLLGELRVAGGEPVTVACHDAAAVGRMFQRHPELVDCLWQGGQLRLNLRHWLRERLGAQAAQELEVLGNEPDADYRKVAVVAALDPEAPPMLGSQRLDEAAIRWVAADALAANGSFLASERTLERLYSSQVLRAASASVGHASLAKAQGRWERCVGSHDARLRDANVVGAARYGLPEHRGEILALALLIALGAETCPAHAGAAGVEACGSCSLLSRATALTPEQAGQLLTVAPIAAVLRAAASAVGEARAREGRLGARLTELEEMAGRLQGELDQRQGEVHQLQQRLHEAAQTHQRVAQSDAVRRDLIAASIVVPVAVLGLAFLWFDERRWQLILLAILLSVAAAVVLAVRQQERSTR